MTVPNLLLIDDDPAHFLALKDAATSSIGGPTNIAWVRTLTSALDSLRRQTVSAVFVNLVLGDSRGFATLERVLEAAGSSPIIVLGGLEDEAAVREALLLGASHYMADASLDSDSFAQIARQILDRENTPQTSVMETERAWMTLNSISDGVLVTDIWGQVTYLNAAAGALTGWELKDAAGHPLADVFQIVDSTTHIGCANLAESVMRQGKIDDLTPHCILIARSGVNREIEHSAAPIYDRNNRVEGTVIVFHDVSLARKMAVEMSHLAQYDPLTRLPNRLLLNDRITQAISMARRNGSQLAVLFVDLDGFKQINDSLGHPIGDKLLQSVAARISGCVRKSDTVSRQGGDEFVILLSEISQAADAAISAAKLISEVSAVYRVDEYRLQVTASIGLSTYPCNGEDAETLIKNADTAMYQAKGRGRNNYQFFRREMGLRAAERHSLEGQLRCAIERDELLLHYQPKVSLTDGTITSAEALIRWHHPERGVLLPKDFLEVAEQSGQLVRIGQWVLGEACRQMRAWLDAGLRVVPVAINISSPEFRSDNFSDGVRTALSNSGLEPRYLELELTESVLMRHAESSACVLQELKGVGVRLAMDDFGTGYSSFNYLTRFAIDALKLDLTFVHDIASSPDGARRINALIGMGKSLNHTIIAEGVETLEQSEFLRKYGCDEAQGYFFGRPMSAIQFENLLKEGLCQHSAGVDDRIQIQA